MNSHLRPSSPIAADQIEALLDAMTLEEMVTLLSGTGGWETAAITRLGIPAVGMSDGPNGARGAGSFVGGPPTACYPVGVALGATFDTDLLREIGADLAEETLAKSASILLGPTVNMMRSPLGGRNFETYSEDPWLAGEITAAYVAGLQSRGVAPTVKHFAANDTEADRTEVDIRASARTLREVYLLPFEMAVKKSGAMAVMSAYNALNGAACGDNDWLLDQVLRHDWGFDGAVVSDWSATRSTVAAIEAGLDLAMPGAGDYRGAKLVAAVQAGAVDMALLRRAARNILTLFSRVSDPAAVPNRRTGEVASTRALIRKAGAAGTVMLKNNGLLPLPSTRQRIAVMGPNADVARIMGGGSAQMTPYRAVTPLAGLRAALPDCDIQYARGCGNNRLVPVLECAAEVAFFRADFSAAPDHIQQVERPELMWFGTAEGGIPTAGMGLRLTADYLPQVSADHRFGLVTSGPSRLWVNGQLVIDLWDDWQAGSNVLGSANEERRGTIPLHAGEAARIVVEYRQQSKSGVIESMPTASVRLGVSVDDPAADLAAALELARTADQVLVFAGLNDEWEREHCDRDSLSLPGAQDALIAQLAAINPNIAVILQSGSPVLMPWLDQVGAVLQGWYPGQECGHAFADVLTGAVDAGGRLPVSFPVRIADTAAFAHYPPQSGLMHYAEGVFIGYRHHDAQQIPALFPFGHGLSYATYRYSDLRTQQLPDGTVRVHLRVTNTSARAGSEVVQIYIAPQTPSVPRPLRELRAFAKCHLAAGAHQDLSFDLSPRAFAWFDEGQNLWLAEAGDYLIHAARSSTDMQCDLRITLQQTHLVPVSASMT